jgi:NADH-ubiquinone oxidoreductase chain 4
MFEVSLIPLFFLIVGWGVQPERLQAGVYFMIYTLIGSLPLLLRFLFIYCEEGLVLWGVDREVGVYLWLGLLVAFLMKLPLFLVHL